jgi:hypothetical protein
MHSQCVRGLRYIRPIARALTRQASTLRENPDSYQLLCITLAHGNVTAQTRPSPSKGYSLDVMNVSIWFVTLVVLALFHCFASKKIY